MMHAIAEPDDDRHDYEPGASGGNESQPNSQSTLHSTPSSSPDEEKCVDIVIYLRSLSSPGDSWRIPQES